MVLFKKSRYLPTEGEMKSFIAFLLGAVTATILLTQETNPREAKKEDDDFEDPRFFSSRNTSPEERTLH